MMACCDAKALIDEQSYESGLQKNTLISTIWIRSNRAPWSNFVTYHRSCLIPRFHCNSKKKD